MALPDLTGQNIENTYQRLVQTDGTNFYDGTGSAVNFGVDPFPYTGSAIISGSLTVIGSQQITGSVIVSGSSKLIGNLQITGSILITGSAAIDGDGVTYIDFNTGSAIPPWKSGRIFWDNTEGALSVYNAEQDITLQVGQETWTRVFNRTGVTITNGSVVRIIGAHGDVPEIILAQAAAVSGSVNTTNQILGFATHDIETNSIGYVTTEGIVRGVNTSAFNDGDALYVSTTPGIVTKTPPPSPFELIYAGVCVKAGPGGSGLIFTHPQEPTDFADLSSVLVDGSYGYGDLWVYARSGSYGVWKHTNQLSGSYGLTGSLTATSLTSSLLGTSSWAINALTASLAPNYVLTSVTSSMLAPYVLSSQTSSFVTNNQTSSFVQNSQTSSFVLNSQTSSMTVLSSSFSSTASYLNPLTQNVEILGNVAIYGTASVDILVTNYQSSSIIYSSGSTKFGDTLDDTHQFTGSILTTGSISSTGTVTAITGSFSYLQGNSPITVGDPITFQQSITASIVSASTYYGDGSNLVGVRSSSFSLTSSYTPNAIVTASATPGAYTIRLTKGNGTFFDVALTQPAPTPFPTTDTGSFFKNAILGGDLYGNDKIVFTKGDNSTLLLSLTSSYVLVSQTSSFVQNSQTSSFVLNNQTSSFVTNSQTSSFVQTSSFNNFTQSIQSEVDSLTNATSSYVLNNQTSSFVINSQTSSFVQNSQTGSFITNNQTSSMLEPYVLTSVTSSMLEPYLLSSQTSSFIVNSQTGSFVTNNQTGSFVQNSQTSSFVLNNQTSSMLEPYLLSSQTGSFLTLNGSLLDINGDIQFNENRLRTSSTTIGQPGKGSDIAYDWGDLTTAPTAGRIVYFASGSGGFGWRDALANTTGSSAGLLGIATNSTSQDEILLKGTIKVSSSLSGLSAGQMVYLSNTIVGGVTGTVPSTSNHVIRVIGHVISPADSTIYFNPDVSFAVIA